MMKMRIKEMMEQQKIKEAKKKKVR